MTIMCSINNSLVQDSNLNNSTGHQFALCESCFWSATIFKSKAQKGTRALDVCPVCFDRNTVCCKVLLGSLLPIKT
jgi:hypothetical protein